MGVRMMKWSPWPPISSRKFEAKILVRCLQGLPEKTTSGDPRDFSRLGVEVNWKGSTTSSNRLNFKRSSAKRNLTKEESLNDDGVVKWNEEFVTVCDLVEFRDGNFQQWEVAFRVFDGLNQGAKRRVHTIATGSLNLAEFAPSKQEKTPINIHLSMPISIDCSPILSLSLTLHEYAVPLPLSLRDDPSGLKAGFKKVKIFKVVSPKKICHQEEGNCRFGPNSLDGVDSDVDNADSNVTKSLDYGTLAYANHIGRFSNFNSSSSSEDDDWTYRHYKSKEDDSHSERRISMRGIFPWRKRKLGFRSPKPKGEPLLKKDVKEEGGDDIDFYRRMLTSSEGSTTSRSSISEFGDDNFIIGKWENKDLKSRDGQMEVKTQIFFASIDQRSTRASGESACTSLVATIADWFQNSNQEMPVKSELDTLILEGSLDWRNLCENKLYTKNFPDKHFDLETVLESKTRNLIVVPEKSFIGFFQLDEGVFDFLHGAMSFDNIWDEIDRIESEKPLVYIVSWNDHFFVLKVDRDAYYIIDTLGERLYEGCDQAYVMKFDKDTSIKRLPYEKEEIVVSKGKESCKEYIKNFLAAIPLRELQTDVEKGLVDASSPLVHHRLQIEFHYTECCA
ncbi:uncharacterized protein LOC111908101 [Lactuca sativa]|uniref:C2 NT-type domain-containing protein n=1 Tax=Lactuca sativa TaxID=4236 RepID=A0A9R1WUC2_LACSA|nr:uncharacterized protein LOC111908101 [Lactuca sativa]KAJ0186774.1 hypothetical protein LSAT_V11C900474150 [Lactuca sativa]